MDSLDSIFLSQFEKADDVSYVFRHSVAELDGEFRLMAAVMEDALYCIQLDPNSSLAKRKLVNEAEEWFHSDEDFGPFSFVCICSKFGLDPSAVRKGVAARRKGVRKWQSCSA